MNGQPVWSTQGCPDDAPDGTCWDCGADKRKPHLASCRTRRQLPQYVPAIIWSCPECLGDLQDEGRAWYYCPACQRGYPPAQVATFDDSDWERD